MKPVIRKNNFRVNLQKITKRNIPSRYYFQRWVSIVLANEQQIGEITIRVVDNKESSYLNQTYRHKAGPTNVLAFPLDDIAKVLSRSLPPLRGKDRKGGMFEYFPLLGDLVLCAPLVAKEAKEQDKSVIAHWAHLVIHGTLHLLGYDHIKKREAALMEKKEIAILQQLGFPNPY